MINFQYQSQLNSSTLQKRDIVCYKDVELSTKKGKKKENFQSFHMNFSLYQTCQWKWKWNFPDLRKHSIIIRSHRTFKNENQAKSEETYNDVLSNTHLHYSNIYDHSHHFYRLVSDPQLGHHQWKK